MVEMSHSTSEQSDELKSVHYVLDLVREESQGRGFEVLLVSRRCSRCMKRLQGKTSLPANEEQMSEIVTCCATQDDFIKPGLPLKEIVFRLLIKEGNQSIPLSRLHYALTEDWAIPTNPMNVSQAALKSILDNDSFYGFKEVSGEEEA